MAMRLLVSGATGLLGRHVVERRRMMGDEVVPLVRGRAAGAGTILWDPTRDELAPEAVSSFDAVVHLAGEPVVGRWTAEKKRRIYDSRVRGTAVLARALTRAEQPPRVFVSASGINIYGECGDRVVDEQTPAGTGFLPRVCVGWEAAAAPLLEVSRVVALRIGVVLAPDGGTVPAMQPIFRLGLGGPVAGGSAYVSWIGLEDALRAVDHVLGAEALAGPVNVVGPKPVTRRHFAAALGGALGRPARLPVPAWVVLLLAGELAEETVLRSVRAVPRRLEESGFAFRAQTVEAALAACGQGGQGLVG